MDSTYKILKAPALHTDSIITIDNSGVHTKDRLGNSHYRGRPQANINVTAKSFDQVRDVWSHQTINGMPVQINSVQVITAENNMLPSNTYNARNIIPREDMSNKNNRVAWYNANVTIGDKTMDTGWVCYHLYRTQYDATILAASEIVRDLRHPRYINRYVLRLLDAVYSAQR